MKMVQEFRLIAIENNYVINELYNEIIYLLKKSVNDGYTVFDRSISLIILNEDGDTNKSLDVDLPLLKLLERYFTEEGFSRVSIINVPNSLLFGVSISI